MKTKAPWLDPIVEEIRKHGEEYAARFGFDLELMVQDLQRQQEKSGGQVVSFTLEEAPDRESLASSRSKRASHR